MGPLELESEEIDYRDAGGGNFLVDIRATLFCRHCLTAGPQSAQVPVSDWAQFRASDNIHVQLSPPRSTGAAPIFISYRRADSHDVTGRIFDRLVSRFGADLVMRDVNSVPVGVNFQEFLAHSLHACRVMLVVIGPNWLLARDSSGARRLDDPSDLVRLEVQTALERGIPVIPLFVTGASMPPADQLPDDIKSICARQGLAVRPDPDFDVDVQRLLAALDQSLNEGSRP